MIFRNSCRKSGFSKTSEGSAAQAVIALFDHTHIDLLNHMGASSSKPKNLLSEEERAKFNRKCSSFEAALRTCIKANKEDSAVCRNLEMRLIMCYADDLFPEESAEHKRCYSAVFSRGIYKGLGHCGPQEEKLQEKLKSKGLYPFKL